MSLIRSKMLLATVATLLLAATFGGSLGVVFAGQRSSTLVAGVNPTVGGPIAGDVSPSKFMSCLPAGSWSSVYLWDAVNQTWKHYFNTSSTGVPAYVNSAAAGGLTVIPRFSGLAIVMKQQLQSPYFPDQASDSCP